eukprot:jgi/Tetstr1/463556/TSEL_008435.t1
MAKVWAPFFECAHISENPSFNTKDRLEVVYPHLHGKLTRFPIEFFPLATNSPCLSVGNLPQTVRHFGFSDTAANNIALTLDMVPTKVFTSTAAIGVRKLWVRALPEPHNEHAYADRKRALQETNGSHGAWPETSWQDAVESVPFVECQSRIVKHCGYSIRSVREWHNDYEMRRGIQQIKNKRFTKSTNTCEPCRGSSAPLTVLVDNRYYQVVAAPRQAGGSSKPASQPPPAGSGGDGSQNGAAAGLLELRAAPPPPPSRLGPSVTAKPPSEPQPSRATKRSHGALSTGGNTTLSPMKLRRKHPEKRGVSPPLKMAKELEDDDPFQAPKPKHETRSSRQAPSGAAAGSRLATSFFPWRCPISASPTHISAQKALISGRKARNAACADISASY